MTISIPAIRKRVSISQYCNAVKTAWQRPDQEFKHTLETWWPGTGKEIAQQFTKGVHDRINQHLDRSGRKLSEEYERIMCRSYNPAYRESAKQELLNF